ncbi:nitroreductase [Hydrogenispora ethanolica]|uniref:Nitroreductase n=1 Tax=Hydrogenispora ethanolica TaxID=1082276 RepID=A0A4R1S722_HYDET|nr:nitroreductase family protein [Hydrogenispora ethanolica]TCL75165.1 nitroreductase [Hydrogenispora ethanolica]
MSLLSVDQAQCVRCGTCAAVCPIGGGLIAMGEKGPEAQEDDSCIGCGHCVAVCPTAALDNRRAPLGKQAAAPQERRWDAGQAAQFLRSRRSIRNYRPEAVPRETLLQLLDMARFAPTASNRQGISFRVISDREKLKRIAAATVGWLEQTVASGGMKSAAGHIRAFQKGEDTILRSAPHLILALCPRGTAEVGRSSADFMLAYAELYALALGLGTCWAGLLQYCAFSGYSPLLELLELPADREVAGALMAGYPRFHYQRLVDREPLAVSWS